MDGEDEATPTCARVAVVLTMLVGGAAFGALIGQSWAGTLIGVLVASPLALLGYASPGALGALLTVLELFSCLG